MLQIQDTLVSLDLVERFFCCDLAACKGQCCLDGDAGAPLEPGEAEEIKPRPRAGRQGNDSYTHPASAT